MDPFVSISFFQSGFDYYVTARWAARCNRHSIVGTLYHHAIERLLKGELAKILSLKDIKKKIHHDLVRAWNEFKATHNVIDLSEFDQLVNDLAGFEDVRYPGMISGGMSIQWEWSETPSVQANTPQRPDNRYFYLYFKKIDSLVAVILKLSRINPRFLLSGQFEADDEVLQALQHNNDHAADWMPTAGKRHSGVFP